MIILTSSKGVYTIEDHWGRIDHYNRRQAIAKMTELLQGYDNFTESEARSASKVYIARGSVIIDSGCEVK